MPLHPTFQLEIAANRLKFSFYSIKYVMRAGPQLRVDAFSISNYGSAMFAQVQPQHSPLMLLTLTRPWLHSVMRVCKQPPATLILHTFAKAARAPPCTLPILGRRFHSHNVNLSFRYNKLTSHLTLNNYSLDTHFYFCTNKPKHQ